MAETPKRDGLVRNLGVIGAGAFVVTNMVGSGIFTLPAIVRVNVGGAVESLAVWAAAGVLGLCGALCYAELATRMPDAGGEYRYLERAFGPLWGFLSGWTSFVVGFSAAVAASALGFAAYVDPLIPGWDASASIGLGLDVSQGSVFASLVVLGLTVVHSVGVRSSGRFQSSLATAVVVAVWALVIAGFSSGGGAASGLTASAPAQGSWWAALLPVSYAYAGWNAAAYMGGEVRRPRAYLALCDRGRLRLRHGHLPARERHVLLRHTGGAVGADHRRGTGGGGTAVRSAGCTRDQFHHRPGHVRLGERHDGGRAADLLRDGPGRAGTGADGAPVRGRQGAGHGDRGAGDPGVATRAHGSVRGAADLHRIVAAPVQRAHDRHSVRLPEARRRDPVVHGAAVPVAGLHLPRHHPRGLGEWPGCDPRTDGGSAGYPLGRRRDLLRGPSARLVQPQRRRQPGLGQPAPGPTSGALPAPRSGRPPRSMHSAVAFTSARDRTCRPLRHTTATR